MATEFIHVIAKVRLLATSEGGKTVPICGSYRPNHNFFGAEDAVMTAGFIDLPDGVMVHPGETVTVPIAIWWWPTSTIKSTSGENGASKKVVTLSGSVRWCN